MATKEALRTAGLAGAIGFTAAIIITGDLAESAKVGLASASFGAAIGAVKGYNQGKRTEQLVRKSVAERGLADLAKQMGFDISEGDIANALGQPIA